MATRRRPAQSTLCIDIGGTGLKACVIDEKGGMLCERVRIETPHHAAADKVIKLLVELVKALPSYHRVSVGFPGVVRDGRVLTAPNLGNEQWRDVDLADALKKALRRPVRVANDADVQGFGAIKGKGLEMVITLGTGFGTSLYSDGKLAPHLELAHMPFRKGETFEQQLGNAARKEIGDERWNVRVGKAIAFMRTLTNFDHLYIGGGNAKKLTLELPHDISTVPNTAGLIGGLGLWRDAK